MPPRVVSASLILTLLGTLAYGAGCTGSVVTTGPGGGSGGGGSLATCGGTCSQDQVMSACEDTCTRIAQAGCSQSTEAQCVMDCGSATSLAPKCASVFDDYLRCLQGVTPTCSRGGAPVFAGCDAQAMAVSDCMTGGPGGPGGPPSLGGFGCTLTTNQCPSIPPAVGTATCSGGGSAGGGGPTTDTYSCQDARGNVWAATCSGATCTCTYNGGNACTCTISASMGTCASCCPGAG